jgi:multidrug efflux pump subunit AcrA (membrane-fusion protein)
VIAARAPVTELTRHARAGFAVLALGALVMVAWVVLAPLSGAIIAPAFVKVDMNRKVVQHQEGASSRILVRDGDRVQRADAGGDRRCAPGCRWISCARSMTAARQDPGWKPSAPSCPVEFPTTRRTLGRPKVVEFIQRESALFRARREALDSQIAVLRKQIRQTEDEAKALDGQIAAEARALKSQKEELALNEKLFKQNYVQKTRLMTLAGAVAEYEARWEEHRAELAKTRQRSSELELRVLAQRNAYVQSATDELKEITTRLFDLEERLRPSKDAADRQRIAAPIAGVVVGQRVFAAGAVVGPREVLMEIVPEDKTLVVEARIRPEDINHVHKGSDAEVRLTAYKQRTTPLVAGNVNYVSADRMLDTQTGRRATWCVDVPEARFGRRPATCACRRAAGEFTSDSRSAFDTCRAGDGVPQARMREPL